MFYEELSDDSSWLPVMSAIRRTSEVYPVERSFPVEIAPANSERNRAASCRESGEIDIRRARP